MYCDSLEQVAETCQLAVDRIQWMHSASEDKESLTPNPYMSVDPAPPSHPVDIPSLAATLLDETLPLFKRYRAMFALRNAGDTESVQALAKGLQKFNYFDPILSSIMEVKHAFRYSLLLRKPAFPLKIVL